ncbi:MAG: 6-phosphogluconate dehydrogenase [Opitutales bacterium TMED158]|nr:MAG: 6-phosphogluconate dehydrogenase [Opitutales bacterium TMED158]
MSTPSKPSIGFIGLGLMGSAMVERLQALGYPMTVIAHRKRKAIDAAVARGATEAKTPSELAASSEVVMLCVDTSNSVEANMDGPDGVIENIKPGSLVIDFGTSLPGSTQRLTAALQERGSSMMDAPLGKTPAHAIDGLLNIMAAGSDEDFNRAKPIFDDLGENVFHVGPIGAGHTLKLINNFFAMTTACAMSEAFAMADLAGIERQTLYSVMSSGPLHSGMMDWIKASAIDGIKDQLAFSIINGAKDVGYYAKMAQDLDVPSFISPATKQALEQARDSGWDQRMVPEMVDFIAEKFAK